MSLHLLGAPFEDTRPLAELVALGTDAQRLDAEERAIGAALHEARNARAVQTMGTAIVVGSLGAIVAGPFGAAIAGVLWLMFDQRQEPTSEEAVWTEILGTAAAERSPALLAAKRARTAYVLAGVEHYRQEKEREADDILYADAVAHVGPAPSDAHAQAAGLPPERAARARDRLLQQGVLRTAESEGVTGPGGPSGPPGGGPRPPPLTLLPGGKGAA